MKQEILKEAQMSVMELKTRRKAIEESVMKTVEHAVNWGKENNAVCSVVVMLTSDEYHVFISESDSKLRVIGALHSAIYDLLRQGS